MYENLQYRTHDAGKAVEAVEAIKAVEAVEALEAVEAEGTPPGENDFSVTFVLRLCVLCG
jgi:hypothetical protein